MKKSRVKISTDMIKRYLALFISVLMIAGTFPGFALDAYAEGADEVISQEDISSPDPVDQDTEDSVAPENEQSDDSNNTDDQIGNDEQVATGGVQSESEGDTTGDEAASYYTVTLNANGGFFNNAWDDSLEETVEKAEVITVFVPVGEKVTVFPVYEQEGFEATFSGWSLEQDGELISSGNDEYAPEADCTLYAVWDIQEKTEPEIGELTIELSQASFEYNGEVQQPEIVLKNGEEVLDPSAYNLEFSGECIDIGTYDVTASLLEDEEKFVSASFEIIPKTITPTIKLSKSTFTYNGKEQRPTVTVMDGTNVLDPSCYSVTYSSGCKNAGTYKVKATLKGNYSGSKTVSFKISPKKVKLSFTFSTKVYTYNGKVRKPGVTVKISGKKVSSAYYTVSYAKGRKKVGAYKVTVKLKGNYSGTRSAYFTIRPQRTKFSYAYGYDNTIGFKWIKRPQQVTGYQIQISTNSDFTRPYKLYTIRGCSKINKTVKKPKAGAKYYARIRTYKKVGKKVFYSAWSDGVNTKIRQCIKSTSYATLEPGESIRYTFTTRNRMVFQVPIKVTAKNFIVSGGFKIYLKNQNGDIIQNDYTSLVEYLPDDYYDDWFYNDDGIVPAGTYTYIIKNNSNGDLKVQYSIYGCLRWSGSASIKRTATVSSSGSVKIGNIRYGCPSYSASFSNNKVYTYCDANGDLWVVGQQKGQSTVTIQLYNGKTYRCRVNITAGDPNFYAKKIRYNTRDNYFEVLVYNARPSDLIIKRGYGKLYNYSYRELDLDFINYNDIVVKGGQTTTVRFYLNGDYAWDDPDNYKIQSMFEFEGYNYYWEVGNSFSWYKAQGKWWNTFWNDYFASTEFYPYW